MRKLVFIIAVLMCGVAVNANAVDVALSWGISDATGVTEYAIGSKVAGVEQPNQYTASPATTATASWPSASPGQTIEIYISPCNEGACGGWSPQTLVTVPPNTPPVGTVTTTTATTTRVGPPAVP